MLSFTRLVLLVTLAVSASASCIHNTSLMRRQVAEEGTVEVSTFGYTGSKGPLLWATLEAENELCRTGKVQSPINIDDTISKATEAPVVAFDNVEEAEFENLGTTLEVLATGKTTFAGKEFTLAQFHMHTPSEHRIAEEYFPLEIHMVHEAADGSIAVIALPFQLTEDNSTLELLTAVTENIEAIRVPGTVGRTGALDFTEITEIIQTTPLFQYTGSLTTPPCAEGLTFLVLEQPLPLNVATYNKIKSIIKFNARYTQNTSGQDNFLAAATVFANEQDGVSQSCDCGPGGENPAPTSPAQPPVEQKTTTAAHEPVPTGANNHENIPVAEACAMQCKGKRWVPDAFL